MNIVLIGPIATGKTTLAALLSQKLNKPLVEVDEVRWEYYKEMGFDGEKSNQIREQEGVLAVVKYWKPFEAYAVEKILQTQDQAVVEFGGGHSVYEDPILFEQVKVALAPHKVILILPTNDAAENHRILNERITADGFFSDEVSALNQHFIEHPSNTLLADHIFYTHGQTPEESAEALISTLDLKNL